MTVRSPLDTQVEMTQIVLPSHTNNHGTIFGGQVAAWCDICAAVSAQRFCRGPVVTASMDQLHFLEPIRKGMVVIFLSQVNQVWRSSMEVGVRVLAEDPMTGARRHCCSAYLTFVALNEQGKPTQLPSLNLTKDAEFNRRAKEADIRKAHRLELKRLRQKDAQRD
ncbi:MAG: acyl-CoA thioesterase [Myxococcota bacterium]